MVVIMGNKTRLVYGVGINDADYVTQKTINGKSYVCPFYRAWKSALERCYSAKRQLTHPTYIGCAVCRDWHRFSNFKAWMETQDWQGKQLDKDILIKGNKIYSPETCVFVDSMTNSFTIDSAASRGALPIGVCFDKIKGMFQSQCSNPFTKKKETIGLFACKYEAHEAWRKRKHEHAIRLADLQSDDRVANALRLRYTS